MGRCHVNGRPIRHIFRRFIIVQVSSECSHDVFYLIQDEGEKSDASTASCPVESHKTEHGFVTVKSEMNLQEYFAQRMAALQRGTEGKANGVCSAAVEEGVPRNDTKEERKKSKNKKRKLEEDNENWGNQMADYGNEKTGKVKEKKDKKRKKEQNTEIESNEVRDNGIEKIKEVREKKSKKRSKEQNTEIESNEVRDNGIEKIKEVREKKTRNIRKNEILPLEIVKSGKMDLRK